VPSGKSFSKDVIHRAFATRLGALNQWLAETDLFHLLGLYAMAGNVLDSIGWPDQLINQHAVILASNLA
jgi:hypothetical protein